jgi:hypothetical protein
MEDEPHEAGVGAGEHDADVEERLVEPEAVGLDEREERPRRGR